MKPLRQCVKNQKKWVGMKRNLISLVIFTIVAGIITAILWYRSYRNRDIDHLYAVATGDVLSDSGTATLATEKIATYSGQRATDMLLQIALGEGPAPEHYAIVQAIKALRARKDLKVGVTLALLLQPTQGLDERKAAAQSLQDVPCNNECIRYVLHYLERIWRGDPNGEDMYVENDLSKSVDQQIKKEQDNFYQALYSVLKKNLSETVRNLQLVYGLGDSSPSPFALDLVSRVKIEDACPLLLHSQDQIALYPSSFIRAPRKELADAISTLNCSKQNWGRPIQAKKP